MSIWSRIFGSLPGGWKTYGPNGIDGPGAFSTGPGSVESVSGDTALRLSAFWAAVNLRAETIGTLPLHIRDKDKNVLTDHSLYDVLHSSPNAMQTAPEFWSMAVANIDMHGNAISIVSRRTRDKSVIALDPVCPTLVQMKQEKSGLWYYEIGSEKYDADNILHLRGFATKSYWGLPRLEVGRHILQAQLSANDFALRAFKQGTKVGGFFQIEGAGQNPSTDQLKEFHKRMDTFAQPENAGRWMTLPKWFKPIGGAEFRVKPADAELLQSRYFGIEEICRLMNTPPQLIGHSDKASSWASSLEQINLFFLMYSLQPTYIRIERRCEKTLLSREDRGRGLQCKFNIAGLLRGDMKTQQAMFASGLQNGYYNADEVREMLDRAKIPGGDEYRVQLNMAGTNPDKEPQA